MMSIEITSRSSFKKLYNKLSPKSISERSRSPGHRNNDNRELRAVFDYMDENADGKISASELQTCVSILGGVLSLDEPKTAVDLIDLNGGRLLDFDEFVELMEGKRGSDEDKKCKLKEAFGMYVVKGSEYITTSSLKMMYDRLGELKSVGECVGECEALIRAIDLNGDGVLSFDEFAMMMC